MLNLPIKQILQTESLSTVIYVSVNYGPALLHMKYSALKIKNYIYIYKKHENLKLSIYISLFILSLICYDFGIEIVPIHDNSTAAQGSTTGLT